MKRRMALTVTDKNGNAWVFQVFADPAYLETWRSFGIEIFEIEESIPYWVASIGAQRPWSAIQSAWHWLRFW